MNKKIKKLTALAGAAAISCVLSASALAAEFIDMPNNWTTSAINNAVKNGLLYGEETADGMKVNPDANITRAQMAAIIVRAFGASKTTDISMYIDAEPNAWYYTELSKAVAMGAFKGDGSKINPENNITFQECFTVMSQVLKMDIFTDMYTKDLSSFTDSDDVDSWAVPYVKAVVGRGYWDGIDSKLLPKQYITRSQFAVLMDNIVKTYINDPGEYKDFEDGNVLVRSNGVQLKDANINGDLIIGDAVTDKEIKIDNSKVSGLLLIRGSENVYLDNGTNVYKSILIVPNLTIYIDENSASQKGGWVCHQDSNKVVITPKLVDAK